MIVKIGLERIDMQEEVTVEVLLDSGAIGLVMSLKFVRKQGFKLRKIKRLIYQGYRKRIEINMIERVEVEQK